MNLRVETRRLAHPGKPRTERFEAAVAVRGDRVVAWLAAGETLFDGLVELFTAYDARAGVVDIVGGTLASGAYHVAVARPQGRVVEYGPPIQLPDGAHILRANGSYGRDLAGNPRLHLHGALVDVAGRTHGGHIAADLCTIAPGGVRAIVRLGIGFTTLADDETGFALFFPFCERGLDARRAPR